MEDTVKKQQKQGLDVPNTDSITFPKPFILDKYNNSMNLKKLKRIKYYTKALLEIRGWRSSEEEVRSCANITDSAEKQIVWYKVLPSYI